MSVFTNITSSELSNLLENYAIGQLIEYTGISAGVTNSNFFVKTTQAEYVLTIFEELTANQLPFFIALTKHLSAQGLCCPMPIADKNSNYIHFQQNKPIIINSKLAGETCEYFTIEHCQQFGSALGKLHLAAHSFPMQQPNSRGLDWHQQTAEKLYPVLDIDERNLLKHEMDFLIKQDYSNLPQGIIHADLFPDNVLFHQNQLSGIIDFYYACTGYWLYDLAICANAWCIKKNGQVDISKQQTLLAAYQQQRQLTTEEEALWPAMRKTAALRFWLSRLLDYHFTPSGNAVLTKDPVEFKQILMGII